jgi:putative endonuclease
MIRNSKNELYIGVSENPKQRLNNHNDGRGSDFTKTGGFKIVFLEEYRNLNEAREREIQIKKWRRDKKEMLIKKYGLDQQTKLDDIRLIC